MAIARPANLDMFICILEGVYLQLCEVNDPRDDGTHRRSGCTVPDRITSGQSNVGRKPDAAAAAEATGSCLRRSFVRYKSSPEKRTK
jgi:hypothetical protein